MAISAVVQLVMGALANRGTRHQMRGFLFTLWKTTEDDQALEKDLEFGLLKAVYDDESELEKDSLYYRKPTRFHKLEPKGLIGLVRAV